MSAGSAPQSAPGAVAAAAAAMRVSSVLALSAVARFGSQAPWLRTCSPACSQVGETIELVESTVGSVYEVLSCLPPDDAPVRRTVLVLTGNPGLAGFYAGFARTLAAELQAEVAVLGLAGHVARTSLRGAPQPRAIGLDDDAAFLPLERSTASELRAVFGALDTDGSGAISASELGEAMERLGMGRLPNRQLRAMLREVDLDGSGAIELGEFETIVARARDEPPTLTAARRRRGRLFSNRPSFGAVVSAQYRTLHALDAQVEHLTEAVGGYVRRSPVAEGSGAAGGEGSGGVPLTIIAHSIGACGRSNPNPSPNHRPYSDPHPHPIPHPHPVVDRSIGAWLLGRVLGRLEASLQQRARPSVLFLMPFLEQNMDNPSYRTKHTLLTGAPWLIPVIARAATPLRLTPTPVRRWLLGGQIEAMDEEYVTLLEKGMLHRGAISNYLHLARSEMYSHQTPFDLGPTLRSFVSANRLRALYVSAGDEWAPISMERRLAEEGVPTTVLSEDELTHMFSCSASQTRIVVEWVKEQVRDTAGDF